MMQDQLTYDNLKKTIKDAEKFIQGIDEKSDNRDLDQNKKINSKHNKCQIKI